MKKGSIVYYFPSQKERENNSLISNDLNEDEPWPAMITKVVGEIFNLQVFTQSGVLIRVNVKQGRTDTFDEDIVGYIEEIPITQAL